MINHLHPDLATNPPQRVDKSGAAGEVLKEAQSINKSLSALGTHPFLPRLLSFLSPLLLLSSYHPTLLPYLLLLSSFHPTLFPPVLHPTLLLSSLLPPLISPLSNQRLAGRIISCILSEAFLCYYNLTLHR